MSVNVEYSSKEVSQVVLQNILKMLVRRNNISSIDKLFNDNKNDFSEKGLIDFKDDKNGKISINLSNGKLSSIVQGSPLDDYLKNNTEVHKILIMKEPSKKVVKQIMNEYTNAEIFFENEMIEKMEATGMIWIKNIYWRLKTYSCVLVKRNRRWFQDNILDIQDLWNIIKRERVDGYSHRAPNKRNITVSTVDKSKCLKYAIVIR